MFSSSRAVRGLFFASLSLSSVLVSAFPVEENVKRATVCNGYAELCSRSYGNVTFVGAHDSYAVGGTDNLFADQDYNITVQLDSGIRMLQMQAHSLNGAIQLCHTNCALYNGGTLQTYLGTVKTWLDANPNEVLSLLIVNSNDLAPTAYDTVFKAVGLDTMSYAPTAAALPASGWPTLGSLIDSGKRLLTFMDASADFTSVPYIIDEFTNIWESPYDVTTLPFDCSVNRSRGDSTTEMYLINHFFDQIVLNQPAPDPGAANVTNAASGSGSLGEQVATCVNDHGRNPNFMLVDFFEYGGGSVFQVAATANGVTYTPNAALPSPAAATSSSSSSGSKSNSALGIQHLKAGSAILASVVFGVCYVLL